MLNFIREYKTYFLLGYFILFLIHFVVKDSFHLIGIVFYALPLPLLILLTLVIAVVFYKTKIIRYCLIVTVMALTFLWYNNYYIRHIPTTEESTNSVALWNIGKKDQLNVQHLQSILSKNKAEVLLLNEASSNVDVTHLKNYTILKLYGSMLIASKGNIKLLNHIHEQDSYKLNHVRIELKDKTLHIALIDIHANPLTSRKNALVKIIDYAESVGIDIIAGDFNTPYESVHFKAFRNQYQTLRAYQNGFSATWAHGLPLLELDQIWMRKSLQPIELKKQYVSSSDHALLLATFK